MPTCEPRPNLWTCDSAVSYALGFRHGGMVEAELRELWGVALGAAHVVELGSFVGMSSFVLAAAAERLTCVDLWTDDWGFIEPAQRAVYQGLAPEVPAVWEAWVRNTAPVAYKIQPLRGRTADLAALVPDASAQVLLIDADHSREAVASDLALWLQKLAPGGTLLLHDYASSWPGVRQAADAAPLEHLRTVAALGVFRRKGDPPC